jgi:hypothetical protein
MHEGMWNAHYIEAYTMHLCMHNAWRHAQCMETNTMHGDMHNAWRHAQCMETSTLHGVMHTAVETHMIIPGLCTKTALYSAHRDDCILKERASMHCQRIACTRSFDMGLQAAKGKKLECSKLTTNNICTQ